jgi:hypothetical protein
MNLPITSQNTALGVVSLRNSRANTCDIRLDGPFPSIRGLSRNLLRPELISTSLGGVGSTALWGVEQAPVTPAYAMPITVYNKLQLNVLAVYASYPAHFPD